MTSRALPLDSGEPGGSSETHKRPPPLRLVLASFAGLVVVMTALVAVLARSSSTIPPALPPGGVLPSGPSLLMGWYKMDSAWYDLIASGGYSFIPGVQSSVAFFPSYPLAVRGLAGIVGNNLVAGTLLAVSCAAGAVVLFTLWLWPRMTPRAALTSLAVLMLYPYAYYLYGAMYSDSMFLLSALAAFALLERRQFWLAGLVGMLATAGRPVGIAVAVGLAVRMLEIVATERVSGLPVDSRNAQVRLRALVRAVPQVRWREAGVLSAVGGLLAWCLYVWIKFGHPLAWMEAQAGWDQASGPATWFKIAYFDTLLHGTRPFAFVLTVQAVMCAIALALLPRVQRTFGWGYLSYSLVVLIIPVIGTKDFMGTGRYVLAAFPVVAVAGMLLAGIKRRSVTVAVLTVLAIGLIGASSLFALGRIIA